MSTNAVIVFIGAKKHEAHGFDVIRLYKHWDGYPTDVLPRLQAVLEKADELRSTGERLLADIAAGLFVGECVTNTGAMAAESGREFFRELPELSDIFDEDGYEYAYVVNLDDYNGNRPGITVIADVPDNSPINPLAYVDHLREECKAEEAACIKGSMDSLEFLGYPVKVDGTPECEWGSFYVPCDHEATANIG